MKIEIDTEKDSEKELHAALRLIESLLGHRQRKESESGGLMAGLEAAQSPQAIEEPSSGGMLSMFDSPPPESQDNSEDPDLKYYDEDVPEIEPY